MADSGQLKTQAAELVKQHIVYDGSSRVSYIYTVRSDAMDLTPCSVVRYAYVGLTSKVEFMKEYLGVWLSAWDLF